MGRSGHIRHRINGATRDLLYEALRVTAHSQGLIWQKLAKPVVPATYIEMTGRTIRST
jgi:hypothetical protein